MKRKIVMMAAMVLSIGCMAVPVAASENVADPAGVAAEASIYSPNCPFCEANNVYSEGTYVSQYTDDLGHTIVYMKCDNCNQLYHYYSSESGTEIMRVSKNAGNMRYMLYIVFVSHFPAPLLIMR